ncbi:MAG: RDD family protein [Rhodobacteraceae bacterium]|nr:RDD family protein [Paracoccaceae bacterium]
MRGPPRQPSHRSATVPDTLLPDPETAPQFYEGVPAKRLVAWFVDMILVVALTLVVVVATFFIAIFIFPLVLLVVNLGYRSYFVARNSATPGMRFVGIELRNREGAHLEPVEAVLHSVAYTLVAAFVLPLVISIVLILTSARKQGLHDMFLGTAAINRPL